MKPDALHETSDLYHGLVAQLTPDLRVVECKDGIQWIIQRREKGHAKRPWRGLAYCTTRAALLRLGGGLEPRVDPEAWASLEALPERMGGRPHA